MHAYQCINIDRIGGRFYNLVGGEGVAGLHSLLT
jgi:hypothetical protein